MKITYPPGRTRTSRKALTELPVALPSRLTTIQKACLDTVFEANPAACRRRLGHREGHGAHAAAEQSAHRARLSGLPRQRAFPDIEIVLQGEGITVVLDGLTDIKKGITKTTFESLPDSPISTFELNLPEGPHSALAANVEPARTRPLTLPTVLTAQNGAVFKQNTTIAVIGLPPDGLAHKGQALRQRPAGDGQDECQGHREDQRQGPEDDEEEPHAGTHRSGSPFTKAGRSLRKHQRRSACASA